MASTLRQSRNERGAALVEGAIVAPVLIFFVLGIVWGSLYLRTYLNDGYAVKVAAQAGSTAATDPHSDFLIMQALKNRITASGIKSVEQIVIYDASSSNSLPTASCQAGIPSSAVGNECNVYSPSSFDEPESSFGSESFTLDNYWPATARGAARSENPKYLGVFIVTNSGAQGLGIATAPDIKRYDVSAIEASTY